MAESMEAKLIKAIGVLTDKITNDVKADDALKYTQAANNIAHTLHIVYVVAESI